MKQSFTTCTVLFFALSVAALAAELKGHWKAEIPTPRGDKREMNFYFKPDGGKFTGAVSMPQGDLPLSGTISGEDVAFDVKMQSEGQERVTSYKGKLVGDELRLMMPGFRNGPPREIIAKLVSANAPVPVTTLPPPSLPELRALPDNGLARTPPMGWNSWNKFQTKIDDKLVREIADAMVTSGMKNAGYTFVNIDDGWEGTRDEKGNIRTNDRFPNMKALADYVHSKGLKLGIYSSPGPRTCAGYEGSYSHEVQDARTFAAWGIDYLKYDWCSATRVYKADQMRAAYQKMGEALRASGRPIVYSLCQYGREKVQEWGPLVGGNLWRTTGDIRDAWQSMVSLGFDKQEGLEAYAGPGHWNDPDMLEVGNGAMTDTEYRTHFSLWSMLAAPLIAGNDLRSMTPAINEILTNAEVIKIDQDPLGKQGRRVAKSGDAEVWARPLQGGNYAVGLFNRGDQPAKIAARWQDVGASGEMKVRDLWAHADRGASSDRFEAEVPAHGVVLIRLSK